MRPDLFLSPDGFLSLGARCRQLPVIHDINFEHHPGDSKWLTSKYYRYFFPRFASEATRIATVSEFSKKDISDTYKIDPSKIDVVYNGINEFFKPADDWSQQGTRTKFSYGKPYFLCVGALHPRKNIKRLIEAFGIFKKNLKSDVKLMFAGPGFWGLKEIRRTIEKCEYQNDIIFTERLSDEDLSKVMSAALALTYVPYFEGFGIPVIEAMAAEIPVITSNVTSLPEVAGDAALLVDPLNISDIAAAMARVYQNRELREELISRGRARCHNFSWDRSAALLWESVEKSVREQSPAF